MILSPDIKASYRGGPHSVLCTLPPRDPRRGLLPFPFTGGSSESLPLPKFVSASYSRSRPPSSPGGEGGCRGPAAVKAAPLGGPPRGRGLRTPDPRHGELRRGTSGVAQRVRGVLGGAGDASGSGVLQALSPRRCLASPMLWGPSSRSGLRCNAQFRQVTRLVCLQGLPPPWIF